MVDITSKSLAIDKLKTEVPYGYEIDFNIYKRIFNQRINQSCEVASLF